MDQQREVATPVRVVAENVGGIDRADVSLQPGVNVLAGRNATNRTSFLQAIMAALGSERVSLKGDAEAGRATLEHDGDSYERRLERRDGGVAFGGDPYLDDPELAELFAFLLESNEARRAVGRGDDLRELIMRPIDTAEIQREISELEAERDRVGERLDELDRLEGELPALEERRVSLEREIEDVEEELASVREEIDALDVDVEESRNRREQLEETFAQLRSARGTVEDLEYDLETERESRRELEREREELVEERDQLAADVEESVEGVAGRIQELRERKRSIEGTLSELQSVIRFNEERLEDGGLEFDGVASGAERESVTDRLVEDADRTVCWTCGSEVDRDRIESTLERLQSLHRETLEERNEVEDRIDELADRQREIRERRQRLEEVEDRIAEVDDELDRHDERIESLDSDRDRAAERVDALEAETESFDDTDYSEVLERHREANELELERERLQSDLGDVRAQIEEVEGRLDARETLEAQAETVADQLTELRTRVERIEADAVDAFNQHMDAILQILGYENVERIWIERRETDDGGGHGWSSRGAFDLHVVRATADDRAYEDTVDHLSESEREVVGLVFALAGYLVHDVHDEVPFVLLDSLEAMDSDRISDLVAYFEEYAACLVVALLPEDADALPDDYHYVAEI